MLIAKFVGGFMEKLGGSAFPAVAILAAVLAGPARGEVVLGNLGASGTTPIGSTSFSPGTVPFAFGFITGTNPLFLELSSASFGLSRNIASGLATAELWSDNGGVPGSSIQVIGTQTVALNSGTIPPASAVTFSATSPIPLVSGSAYWIVLTTSTDASLRWHQPYGSIAEQNSSSWSGGSGKQFNGTNWVNTFRIGAVSIFAVPEPTTTLMLTAAAGVGGVALLRRRARRSARRVT